MSSHVGPLTLLQWACLLMGCICSVFVLRGCGVQMTGMRHLSGLLRSCTSDRSLSILNVLKLGPVSQVTVSFSQLYSGISERSNSQIGSQPSVAATWLKTGLAS